MNILFINTSKIWGGNEKWTHMAAHALAEDNEVTLAYRSSDLGRRFLVNKLRLPFWNRLDVYTLIRLSGYIKKHDIKVVVSTNRKFYLLGGLAARMTGCRHFVRCGIVWKVPDTKYYRILFEKFIDGIIVNAAPVRERLVRSGFIDKNKIHLIYNGLDTKEMENSKYEDADKPFDFTIISSGELIPRKGYEFLIRSFANFLKKNPDAEAGLVIMGKGRQKKELKILVKKQGIDNRVIFAGFVDNPYPLLSQADLFVSVSRNEGVSNAMLEAMYLGVPVITTPAGGAGDVISHGQNGFLVEYGDGDELVRLIEQASEVDNYLFKNVGKAGCQTAASTFSMKQMTSSLQLVFDSSLQRV